MHTVTTYPRGPPAPRRAMPTTITTLAALRPSFRQNGSTSPDGGKQPPNAAQRSRPRGTRIRRAPSRVRLRHFGQLPLDVALRNLSSTSLAPAATDYLPYHPAPPLSRHHASTPRLMTTLDSRLLQIEHTTYGTLTETTTQPRGRFSANKPFPNSGATTPTDTIIARTTLNQRIDHRAPMKLSVLLM